MMMITVEMKRSNYYFIRFVNNIIVATTTVPIGSHINVDCYLKDSYP
jgi:small basic protein